MTKMNWGCENDFKHGLLDAVLECVVFYSVEICNEAHNKEHLNLIQRVF